MERLPLWTYLNSHRRLAFYLALVTAGVVDALLTDRADRVSSLVLAVLTPLSLLLLNAAPRVAVAASLLVLVVVSVAGRETGLAVTALAVVLVSYVAAHERGRPVLLFVLSGSCVALSAYYEAIGSGQSVAPDTFIFGVFGTALAIGLGTSLRLHRQALAELDARNRELEELRIIESRRAVADERTRIARELHDVVAHHVSAIIVRAQAAEHVRPRQPQETDAALTYVIDAAGETLTALRRMVGLLRTDITTDPNDATTEAALAPQPGLEDLPILIDSAREAGGAVELTHIGDSWSLPLDLQLTAYRVVQESLTNSLRHAPQAPVNITLAWTTGVLELAVENAAPRQTITRPAHPGGGHGLQGMRERLGLCHGNMQAGPTASGGWRVRATIPISAPISAASVPADRHGEGAGHGDVDRHRQGEAGVGTRAGSDASSDMSSVLPMGSSS